MAIDTATKRKSIAGLPWLIPGVTPTLTPGQAWRQSAGWNYGAVLTTFVYSLRNHAIFAKFRDKRIAANFRDKSIAANFRNKSITANIRDKRIPVKFRDKRIVK